LWKTVYGKSEYEAEVNESKDSGKLSNDELKEAVQKLYGDNWDKIIMATMPRNAFHDENNQRPALNYDYKRMQVVTSLITKV